MSLITGSALVKERFFSAGNARSNGTSFDLTIGAFFDSDGNRINGDYLLEPGNMVQVVSAEVFNLPDTVTGHVSYKTEMTKKGIWGLTIGIVDPGWNGPVTTSLLNFSKARHTLHAGKAFLRVSLFEHPPVPEKYIRKMRERSVDDYMLVVQDAALNTFPKTFLDMEGVSKRARNGVLRRFRSEAMIFVALIGVLFTVIQLVLNSTYRGSMLQANDEFGRMRTKVELLETRMDRLETARPGTVGAATTVSPVPKENSNGHR